MTTIIKSADGEEYVLVRRVPTDSMLSAGGYYGMSKQDWEDVIDMSPTFVWPTDEDCKKESKQWEDHYGDYAFMQGVEWIKQRIMGEG